MLGDGRAPARRSQQIAKCVCEWNDMPLKIYVVCEFVSWDKQQPGQGQRAHCHCHGLMSVDLSKLRYYVLIFRQRKSLFRLLLLLFASVFAQNVWRCCELRPRYDDQPHTNTRVRIRTSHNDMLTIDKRAFSLLSLLFIIQCDQATICARFSHKHYFFRRSFGGGWSRLVAVVVVDIYKLSCHFCSTDTVKFYLCECLLMDESESVSINGAVQQPAYMGGRGRVCVSSVPFNVILVKLV